MSTVRAARSALANALKAEYEGTVFLRNLNWFWKGALLSILGLIVSALLLPVEQGAHGPFRRGLDRHLVGRAGLHLVAWCKEFGSARGIVAKAQLALRHAVHHPVHRRRASWRRR